MRRTVGPWVGSVIRLTCPLRIAVRDPLVPGRAGRPYRTYQPIGSIGRQSRLAALPAGTRSAAPAGRWRCRVSRCRDRRDSTDVTGYTDVRTYVSQIIRQNCRREVSYPMHIVGAIAYNTKTLPCANLMITHMGFHAMPPGVSGQGRVAQLVNPLSACSLFGVPLMTPGGTNSQVAACSDGATRRFGRVRRSSPGPAAIRPGPAASASCGPAEMERRVHAPWLAWTGLCVPAVPGPSGRLTVGGLPGRAVSAPRRRAQGLVRCPAAMAGPGPVVSGRNWGVRAAGPESGRCRPVNSTSQYPLSGIGVGFYLSWPLFRTGPCTCSAQFTYHSVVGVFE
jgi:hypothetical protein